MSATTPRISVLVPLYNTQEEHLREAIESILNQSFPDFELLLLNDSPDNTRLGEIVAEYRDPRIRYMVNERNMGITPSRNKLLELARGEYIAVMDHDDISLPERLERQVTYLDAHPQVGVVGSWVEEMPVPKRVECPVEDHEIRVRLTRECVVFHSASMLRRSVLEQSGVRYESCFSPSEDYALWIRLMAHTQFYNIPEVLFRYRVYEGNTSKWQAKRMELATQALRAIAEHEFPELVAEYNACTCAATRVYGFGFLPLLKITHYAGRTDVFLFSFIPLLCIRSKRRRP